MLVTRYSSLAMRFLVTILVTAGVITLHAFDNPQGFERVWKWMTRSAESVLSDKEIRIEGLRTLARMEVEKLLPTDRSVAWWHANGTEVQTLLKKNPWVAEASVASCPETVASQWGCFVVSITEHVPTFNAALDGAEWAIAEDGSFIVPIRDLKERSFNKQLVVVRGLASRANSPDLVRAQLAAASKLRAILEKEVGRSITTLDFQGHGDFSVMFRGLGFPIVFAAGKDAKVPLLEQGTRCAELLKRMRDRLGEIEKVDLAFDRVGVVTFKNILPPAAEPVSPRA
jgi:hypothetical protein